MTVRWESAAPVREANAKAEDKNAAKIAEWSSQYYVVSVSGGRMMGGRGRRGGVGPEGEAKGDRPQPDPARMEQMRERMKQSAALRRKGKDAIAPANVEMLETAEGRKTIFLFPRSEAISADEKDLSFEMQMGPISVKAKFVPKDMVYNGKLEL